MRNDRVVQALRDFWSGISSATLATSLLAVAFAAFELAVACVVVTPRNLVRIRAGWLMEHRNDASARSTMEGLRARFSRLDGAQRTVVFIGASNARMSLPGDGAYLQGKLRRAVGSPVRYRQFFRDGQPVVEWFMVADQLPETFHGVVVLSVFEERTVLLARGYPGDLLAIPSPSVDHPKNPLARALRRKRHLLTGNYFLDHLRFFAARRGALLRLGPSPEARLDKVRTHQWKHKWRTFKKKMLRSKGPNMFALLPQLRQLVTTLREMGAEVVLVEAPINPLFDRMKPASHSRTQVYEPRMRRFAEELGAHYWNPSPECGLVSGDFMDPIHMRSPAARRCYQGVLVDKLARLMKGETVADGPPTPDVAPRKVDLDRIETYIKRRKDRRAKAEPRP